MTLYNNVSRYTNKKLINEARRAVKGKGRYLSWEIIINKDNVTLRAYFSPATAPGQKPEFINIAI